MTDAIHIRESDADMREIAKAHLGYLWNELDYVECAMVLNGLKAAHDLGRRPPSRPKPHGREEMSEWLFYFGLIGPAGMFCLSIAALAEHYLTGGK